MPADNDESGNESDSSTSSSVTFKKKPTFKISKVAQLAHSVKPGQKLIPVTNGKPIKIIGFRPSLKDHPGSLQTVSVSQKPPEPPHNGGELSQKPGGPLQNSKEGIQTTEGDPVNPKDPQEDVFIPDQHPAGKVLLDILNITQNNTLLLNELSKKMDKQGEQLSKLSQIVHQRGNPTIASTIAKPDFVPFHTAAEVKEYEKATEENRTKLRNYISAFKGGRCVMDNVRYILKNNLLMMEELLITYNYFEPSKGKPNTLAGSMLDRDFLSALRSVYPNLTVQQYHEALKTALKAADSRMRVKTKSASEPPKKRKKSTDFSEDFYSKSSENYPPVD
ncbi:uncharacterized protein LOC123266701 isoform X1 [Cotesia glomerata]|uniref:DUF4806 domain-containing protein n=1 Tax=Cotesia glomerata TaxID=32391 RepID=A0AAV7HXM1_COTGL|nr:uncharacterized protein LOC123266701 isoform X1 [Cotesia glomerata]KAH0535216.1 hypothetical protein KQX54_014964 [Cotesia glomerata]